MAPAWEASEISADCESSLYLQQMADVAVKITEGMLPKPTRVTYPIWSIYHHQVSGNICFVPPLSIQDNHKPQRTILWIFYIKILALYFTAWSFIRMIIDPHMKNIHKIFFKIHKFSFMTSFWYGQPLMRLNSLWPGDNIRHKKFWSLLVHCQAISWINHNIQPEPRYFLFFTNPSTVGCR